MKFLGFFPFFDFSVAFFDFSRADSVLSLLALLVQKLETRLRSEKEKLDDLTKVSQSKDEQIAHLRRCVKSILERLGNDVC